MILQWDIFCGNVIYHYVRCFKNSPRVLRCEYTRTQLRKKNFFSFSPFTFFCVCYHCVYALQKKIIFFQVALNISIYISFRWDRSEAVNYLDTYLKDTNCNLMITFDHTYALSNLCETISSFMKAIHRS